MKKLFLICMFLLSIAASSYANDSIPAVDNSRKIVFAWGADVGASIDMTGSDMSADDAGT